MQSVEPIATWDVRPWGTPAFRIADVNGDGRNELLFLQSAGGHANKAFDPRVSNNACYRTGVEEQELFCMTLADAAGRILWQIGKPWACDRPFSWNGDWTYFCEIVDLDGDGRVQIMLVHKGQLRIYDGATGRLLRTRELPDEAFCIPRAIRTDRSGSYHIFTKSGGDSDRYSYGNPSLLLSRDLDVVWEKEVPGAGHRANFADIDGDGLDEILIGFSLFDHDGSLLWSHPPLGRGDHLDSSAIADLDGDGRLSIAVAHDGFDAVVHRADGSVRFSVPMHHCQTVAPGKFFSDRPGLQIAFTDKAVGTRKEREACIVDRDGREISRHGTLGYYQTVNWPTQHGPQSFLCCERPPEPDGEYRVLCIDPLGRPVARFNARASFADHIRRHGLDKINPEFSAYYGAMLAPAVGDLDGDGREELLVTDRQTVWIFRPASGHGP